MIINEDVENDRSALKKKRFIRPRLVTKLTDTKQSKSEWETKRLARMEARGKAQKRVHFNMYSASVMNGPNYNLSSDDGRSLLVIREMLECRKQVERIAAHSSLANKQSIAKEIEQQMTMENHAVCSELIQCVKNFTTHEGPMFEVELQQRISSVLRYNIAKTLDADRFFAPFKLTAAPIPPSKNNNNSKSVSSSDSSSTAIPDADEAVRKKLSLFELLKKQMTEQNPSNVAYLFHKSLSIVSEYNSENTSLGTKQDMQSNINAILYCVSILSCLERVFALDNRRKKAWMKISQLVREARVNNVAIEEEFFLLEDLNQFQIDLELDLKVLRERIARIIGGNASHPSSHAQSSNNGLSNVSSNESNNHFNNNNNKRQRTHKLPSFLSSFFKNKVIPDIMSRTITKNTSNDNNDDEQVIRFPTVELTVMEVTTLS